MNSEMVNPKQNRRRTLYTIIFESDTPAGWAIDVALIATPMCQRKMRYTAINAAQNCQSKSSE